MGADVDPLRVMVVEDEAIIRTFITFALRGFGCDVVAEYSFGEDAVHAAEKMQIDLVFMDIRLKGPMNGVEAANAIVEKANSLIVFMSAYDKQKVGVEDLFPGLLGYLVKPVHGADLRNIVDKAREKLISGTGGADT